MFSLPVGYFYSADLYILRKCNLKPGLRLILRGKESSAGKKVGDGCVNGKLWSVVFNVPVLAGTSSNGSDTGRSWKKIIRINCFGKLKVRLILSSLNLVWVF
jgi:hypothetical protein